MRRRKSEFLWKPETGKEFQTAVVSPSAAPPWIELPGDITANILQRLGAEEVLERAQKVCTTWRKVSRDPAIWRVIELGYPGRFEKAYDRMWFEKAYDKMCRNAVDRSRGQLVDLSITYFGDDELMNYIADRSSNLTHLQLISCYGICYGLAEAAKKLPQLEELHLIIMKNVPAKAIEAIGNSCTKLKSFTYNFHGSPQDLPQDDDDDEEVFYDDEEEDFYDDEEVDPVAGGCNNYARAIANSMPNLLHLRLCGDGLNNEGLEAILDGCPCLESLDLRQCYKLDLAGDLGIRCSEQIKVLKRPSDSVSDVWWLTDKQLEAVHLHDSEFTDYFFDRLDGYHGNFERYGEYTSPVGFGYFGRDAFSDED